MEENAGDIRDEMEQNTNSCGEASAGNQGANVQLTPGLEAKLRTLMGHQRTIDDLNNEIKWSTATAHEKDLEMLKKRKGHLQVQVPALSNKLKVNALSIKRAKEKLSRLRGINRGNITRQLYLDAQDTLRRSKSEYLSKLTSHKSITMRIERQEKRVAEMLSLCVDTERDNTLKEIACEERECIELKDRIQEIGNNYCTAHKVQLSLRSEINWHNNQMKIVSERVLRLQNQISILQGDSFSCFNSDEEYAALIHEIELGVERKAFKKTPLGPVGKYIAFKDDFWASAIMNYLSSVLGYFCVDNWSDYLSLLEVFKKFFGTRPKPEIIISNFYDAIHDVSEHAVRPPEGMCSILDVLSVDNPVIANFLIDRMEVECMLLVPSSTEARELMNSSVLPLNIKAALTAQGVEIHPANSQVQRVNMYEEIQLKEEELEGFERYKLCLESEAVDLNKALQEKDVEVAKFHAERKALQETLSDKKANVTKLTFSVMDEPMSIAQAEHREALEELNILQNELSKIRAECRPCINAIIEGKVNVAALREIAPSFLYERDVGSSAKKTAVKELKTLEAEKKYLSKLLCDLNVELRGITKAVINQQMVTNKALCLARKASKYRLMSKRNIGELCHEKKILEKLVVTLSKKVKSSN